METLFILLFFLSGILLLIGIVTPKTISKWFRSEFSRKKVLGVFGGLMVGSFIAFGIVAPPVEKQVEDTPTSIQEQETPGIPVQEVASSTEQQLATTTPPEESTPVPVSPTETTTTSETPIVTTPAQKTELENTKTENTETLYLVTRVVDGDTFDVNINGQTKRIRLIGVDTPETVDPRKPVQCFGKEASNKAVELLLNKKVKLDADSTQGETDKYGRLLRYAIREDGLFYNKWIIENGYAHEYTYNTPYKYQTEFKKAEQEAQSQKRGLWADNACPTAPAEEPKPVVTPTPVAPVTSEPTPATPTQSCTIKGNISSDGRKLYHLSNCPSYSRTVIDEGAGEKWFCSEQEATQAGWTKAGNC